MKNRFSVIYRASKPISSVWRNRLRALKLQHYLEYFGLALATSVATIWLEYWSLPIIFDLMPTAFTPIFASIIRVSLFAGAATVILALLSIFAYGLSAIQAWLPLWASAAITCVIATLALGGIIDVKLWLVQKGALLYPIELRYAYLEWVPVLQPVLVFVVTIGTLLIVALSMYVQVRGTAGFLRDGESYRASEFFKAWSSPLKPTPRVWHILRLETDSSDVSKMCNTSDPRRSDRIPLRPTAAKKHNSKAKRQAQGKARRLHRR